MLDRRDTFGGYFWRDVAGEDGACQLVAGDRAEAREVASAAGFCRAGDAAGQCVRGGVCEIAVVAPMHHDVHLARWQAARGYPSTGYLNKLQHKALISEIVSARVASGNDTSSSSDDEAGHVRHGGGGGGRRYYRSGGGGGPGAFFGGMMGGLFRR